MFFGCDCCDNTAVVGSLFSYKIFIAIAAQASASASAWWCFSRMYPQASETVCSWWFGSLFPKNLRAARQVHLNL